MSSVIDFDRIDKYGPQELRETVAIDAKALEREEVVGVSDVTIDLEARKGDLAGEYVVEGTVKFEADLLCARCLDPLPFADSSSFTVRYVPRPAAQPLAEEEQEITAEELDVEYFTERKLPLTEFALEQIQLAIPMKSLCGETCRGLCPTCGTNLNRETCSCGENLVDDRWEALRGIRDDLTKKSDS